MTEEELVRRSIEIWNEDDWESLEALWDSGVEIVSPEGWPESGTFRGSSAVREQLERVKGSWAEERVELTAYEAVPLGGLAGVRWVMKGEASGAPLEVDMWALYEFRGDLIHRITYFLDRKAAEAAGG